MYYALSHRDRLTMNNLARLKPGMREVDVRRLLGEPSPIRWADEPRWQLDAPWSAEEWNGRTMSIRVLFNPEGRLSDWTATATGEPLRWHDRLVGWLGF
jgi:hypothetical protein